MKAITEKLDVHERKLSHSTSIYQSFISSRVETVRNRNQSLNVKLSMFRTQEQMNMQNIFDKASDK